MNYRKFMSEIPNFDHSVRYIVIAVPSDGGRPVVWKTDNLSRALKIQSAALQITKRVWLIDSETDE